MDKPLNPYRTWLNCDSDQPNFFELLGISTADADPKAIRSAASARLAQVRRIRPGDAAKAWQALIDEINQAQVTLCDPEARAKYLAGLKRADQRTPSPAAARTRSAKTSRSRSEPRPSSNTTGTATLPHEVRSPATSAPDSPAANQSTPGQYDPLDPMAPLIAPAQEAPTRDPVPPTASLAPQQTGPAGMPVGDPSPVPVASAQSSSLVAKARKRSKRQRNMALATVLLAVVFVGLLSGVVYFNRAALFGPREIAGGPEPAPTPSPPTPTPQVSNEPDPSVPVVPDANEPTNAGPNTDPDVTSDPEPEPETPDPEMMNNDPPSGGPDPDEPSRTLTRPEAYQLGLQLQQAHQAVSARDFDLAAEQWEQARQLAEGTEYRELVDRLQLVGQTTRRCWDQVAEAAGKLQSTEELQFSPTVVVVVVEASKDRLVYRVNGQRQERAPRELPPGLGKLILESVLEPGTELSTLLGALYAAEAAIDPTKRENAETYWREADAEGANVQDLLLWLADDYQLVAKDYEPVEPPDAAALPPLKSTVKEELAELLDRAKTPAQRIEVGQEIIDQATALEAEPPVYARFEVACELIATSGHISELTAPVKRWSEWFKLDKLAVMTHLLETCSQVSAPTEECQETVRQSLDLAGQAISRKKLDLAERLLEAAGDAAQKSKDAGTRSETLVAVRQLRQRLNDAKSDN